MIWIIIYIFKWNIYKKIKSHISFSGITIIYISEKIKNLLGVPACECLPLSFFGVDAKIPLVLVLGLAKAISPCFLSSSLALLGLHTTSVTTPSVFFRSDAAWKWHHK